MKRFLFSSLIFFVLCVIALSFSSFGKRVYSFLLQGKMKDASIVISNDRDQTMKEVFDEFKQFDQRGYAVEKYPELEKLYSEKTWRLNKLSGFSTSIKMQSFGAEKEIMRGNWKNLIHLIDDCISGYKQFIPLNQETVAITYIYPALNVLKRIANQNKRIPKDIRQDLIEKLIILKEIIKMAPTETSNNFKDQCLYDLKNVIKRINHKK